MFPGGFRAKLNSRSHHRASVFATTVVALLPSFLALSPLLAYAYFSNYTDRLKGEEWTFLTCVSLGAGRALIFLALRHALLESAGVWDQFKIQTAFARRSRRE